MILNYLNMQEEKKFDYTKAVAELEQIAAKVEDPATSLDDIGALVKRSKELIEACRQYLRTVRESMEDAPQA
jgi:Exonuclease VII small subunit.